MPSRERPMCKEVGINEGQAVLVQDNNTFILWRDEESNCPRMCRIPSSTKVSF